VATPSTFGGCHGSTAIVMAAKIVHLGKYYPPHKGGMETHLQALVSGMRGLYGIDVLVANDRAHTNIEHLDGARVRRVPTFGTLASMPLTPTLPFELWRSHADLVHVHTPNPGAAFALAVCGYRGPLIITHHSDTLGRKHLNQLSAPFVRSMMQNADAIIATSQRYLNSSRELAPHAKKCYVIPLGLDKEAFRPARSEEIQRVRERLGRRLVLAVGRLVEYKGFIYLLHAMKHLDATLAIVGTGPQASTLERLAHELNIRGRVHFLGHIEELAPYLAAAEVFALPSISRAEAFGMVQLEAMAAGLPVVNTNIESAVPEISIHGKTGWTVPPRDPAALAKALNSLLENGEMRLQMGRAARARAAKEFCAESINWRTVKLYEAVLRERGSLGKRSRTREYLFDSVLE
jgi:glycosyltransferase involved in cell wall biosynthesis